MKNALAIILFLISFHLSAQKAELTKYKSRAREDASVQPRINRSSNDDESESKGKPRSALDAIRSQLRSY